MWWAYNSIKESPWAAAAFREARDQRGQQYRLGIASVAVKVSSHISAISIPHTAAVHKAATVETSCTVPRNIM